MFKREGSPKKISIVEYDEEKQEDLKCPSCGTVIGKMSNGVKRVASKTIIGILKQRCPKCEREITL